MKAKLKNGELFDIINYEEEFNNINKNYNVTLIRENISDEVINAILSKDEEERTVEELRKIVLRKEVEDRHKLKLAELAEYKQLETVPYNEPIEEHQALIPYFEETDEVIYKKYKPKTSLHTVYQKIQKLKKDLTDTDYIIIKVNEAKISMSDLPYSQEKIDETIRYRQVLRDKINELEKFVN